MSNINLRLFCEAHVMHIKVYISWSIDSFRILCEFDDFSCSTCSFQCKWRILCVCVCVCCECLASTILFIHWRISETEPWRGRRNQTCAYLNFSCRNFDMFPNNCTSAFPLALAFFFPRPFSTLHTEAYFHIFLSEF